MARSGGIAGALVVAILFYVFVYKSQWFKNFLNRGHTIGGGTVTTTTTKGGKTTTTTPSTTTTGGAGATGSHVYPTTGKTCSCVGASQPLHTSAGTCTTIRSNCNNCNLLNYEATAILQFGGGCSCGGDEATIKHYGPTHQDGNCCWAMSVVHPDGSCAWGGEGPHGGTTNKNQGSIGNAGSLANKKVGIKSVIWKTASGAHQELFVDPSGSGTSWKKMGARDMTQWGDKQKTNVPSSSQQVEFRVDCTQAKWLSTSITEIKPPGATAAPAQISARTARIPYRYGKVVLPKYNPKTIDHPLASIMPQYDEVDCSPTDWRSGIEYQWMSHHQSRTINRHAPFAEPISDPDSYYSDYKQNSDLLRKKAVYRVGNMRR
jgi:hypothetical protein